MVSTGAEKEREKAEERVEKEEKGKVERGAKVDEADIKRNEYNIYKMYFVSCNSIHIDVSQCSKYVFSNCDYSLM